MRCAGVLVAGGKGRRFGGEPKQLRPLAGQPLLIRAAWALRRARDLDTLVIVVPEALLARCRALLDDHGLSSALLCAGGARRVDSVAAGLAALPETTEIVAIHDVARPLVPTSLIDHLIAEAQTQGAVIPALALHDTLKEVHGTHEAKGTAQPLTVAKTLDRDRVWLAQTPQVFRHELLKEALASWRESDEPEVTDDAQLIERMGHAVTLVHGDPRNFKITVPADLARAEEVLRGTTAGASGAPLPRSGLGFDVHRLVPGRPLILGGVSIPFARGLAGHSDADVLCHAIGDALLGAGALGDLGQHFPPEDPRWKDADSLILLGHIVSRLGERNLRPVSVDSVIVCEEPKLAPYLTAMRAHLSAVLDLDIDRVSVKATTSEGLGATGRGEGIAAQATVLVI